MTNTKKQLMTAIAMLVVAALALGTSTYAWFVSNTTVKVDEMQFTAQSVDNLQIALTTDAWHGQVNGTGATAGTYKTLITAQDLNELYTSIGAVLTTAAIEPASTINGQTFYKIASNSADDATTWELVNGTYTAKKFTQVDNVSENCVKAIPLFIRSTSGGALYLKDATTVSGDAAPAARIAFVVDGATKAIWAPSAATIDGRQITTLEGADGIHQAVSNTTSVGDVSDTYTDAKPTAVKFATLSANTPVRVMVYIWLEGCDEDCVAGLSAKDLSVNLQFESRSN